MKHLIREVHRRSLWQVLGIYLGASWLVLQVVDTMAGALSLPDWSASFAFFLLVIGLPIVLATAFVQGGGPAARATARAAATESGPDTIERGASPVGDDVSGSAGGGSGWPGAPADTADSGHRRLLTWRNAILGGGGAFALLGLLSAGWLGSRALGVGPAATLQARGVIDDEALVVLADFEAADAELAAAATEALRVDLSQSQAIRLADQAVIEEALARMERDPSTPLSADLAREVALREGAGAVVLGQISRAGDGYVFSADLVDGAEGTTLTSQRETADGAGDVIEAIESLSKKLRERIGESLGSIRAGEPLERVTTSDLEALELYSRASRIDRSRPAAGDEMLRLYEQAVERDSGFAMAWSALAVRLRNRFTERARMLEAQTRAYELRDRLTPRERYLTSAFYYHDVLGEPERAAQEYEAMLELDSADVTAITNIGVVYHDLRRHDLAEPYVDRLVEMEPEQFSPGFWNLIQTQVHLGKFEEAWETVDTVAARFSSPDEPGPAAYVGSIVASNEGDFDRADALLRENLVDGISPGFAARVHGDLGAILGAQGQAAAALERFERAREATRSASPGDYWKFALQTAWLELVVLESPEDAVRAIDAAEVEVPFTDLSALDRPYGPVIEVLARAGALERARTLLDEMETAIPSEYRIPLRSEMARARAEVALAEGRYDEAIDGFRKSDVGYCTICALTGLAAAYDAAGRADSAAAVYTRYVETHFPDRYASYAYPLGPALGPSLERLGQLHDEQGNLQEAARYYAQLVQLWSAADPELRPRVDAAQTRLEAILQGDRMITTTRTPSPGSTGVWPVSERTGVWPVSERTREWIR